jgi:hypothetical protein
MNETGGLAGSSRAGARRPSGPCPRIGSHLPAPAGAAARRRVAPRRIGA